MHMKRTAIPGSVVTVSYIGTLDNGRIFQDTGVDGPLIFTIGNDQVFAALEAEVIGMVEGEVKNIVLAPEQAYGPRRSENILTMARSLFPVDKELIPGQKLRIEFGGNRERLMQITTVSESEVTLDGNHPLAGYELTFALRLDRVA